MNTTRSDPVIPGAGDALVIVDVQVDFLPGGSLAVPGGDEIVPVLNRYIDFFAGRGLPVVATRDWHPPGHCSFKAHGGTWPPHCVADTPGAAFAPGLQLPPETHVVSKAVMSDRDAYSGLQGTDLNRFFKAQGIRRIFTGGLATDYCVLNTVQDLLRAGYTTVLLQDAIRAVNLNPTDGPRAIDAMLAQGAMTLALENLA